MARCPAVGHMWLRNCSLLPDVLQRRERWELSSLSWVGLSPVQFYRSSTVRPAVTSLFESIWTVADWADTRPMLLAERRAARYPSGG